MGDRRWSWRWWFDLGLPRGPDGKLMRPSGSSWRPHQLLPFTALLPLVPMAPARLTSDMPFNGLDLALLLFFAHLLLTPQLCALACLDRIRRGRRPFWNWHPPLLPAGWYRLVTGIGLTLLLVDLAAVPVAWALGSGVVGPRYPETVVFEVWFRGMQVGLQALLIGAAAAVTVLALRVARWSERGAPLPA
jgi:hypothetical protein